MEQKTTKVYLRTIIEFADNNGYRITGNCLQYDKGCQFDRDRIEKEILSNRPNVRVRCSLVGRGIDFRRSVSLDGNYEFLLIS